MLLTAEEGAGFRKLEEVSQQAGLGEGGSGQALAARLDTFQQALGGGDGLGVERRRRAERRREEPGRRCAYLIENTMERPSIIFSLAARPRATMT